MTLFLITGCGRSGSLWFSQLLNRLGFPNTHETQFSPECHGPLRRSEVSWLAVPFLKDIPASVPIVRLVRNPYSVVMSGVQMDFQRRKLGSPFDKFLVRHRPDIAKPKDHLGRIIRWATMWDTPLDDINHHLIQIDRTPKLDILETIERFTASRVNPDKMVSAMAHLGSTVNTKERTVEITRHMIDEHPEGWRVRKRAERFGYDYQ